MGGDNGQWAVEARDLVKQFGPVRAVDGISFRVRRGECFGLLGPNGAGKTTTVRMVYGYSPRSGGELEVFGLDVGEHPIKMFPQTSPINITVLLKWGYQIDDQSPWRG